MKEFEDIPHSGGKITFYNNGQTKYKGANPCPMAIYEIIVSFNGIILCRGDFLCRRPIPNPAINVMIISDREKFFGYSCPRCRKYFRANKLMPDEILCPYCLYIDHVLKFLTESQHQYIELFVQNSVESMHTGKDICLNLDSIVSGLDNNIIKIDEERQQKLMNCEKCKIKIDIIGVYASCPICGKRNSLSIFLEEVNKVKEKIISGNIDFEDALNKSIDAYSGLGSDLKSILEFNIPFCKKNVENLKRIDFQKITETNAILEKLFGIELFSDNEHEVEFLKRMFQKRHLIVHNSSVVDEKYLKKTEDKSVKIHQKIHVSDKEFYEFLEIIVRNTEFFFDNFSSMIFDYIKKSKKINVVYI